MQRKSALVVLAEGFEEVEALAPVDLLRRAEVDCTLAFAGDSPLVVGRNGICVQGDVPIDEVRERLFDGLVLPGGPATAQLRKDERVRQLVRAHAAAGRVVGAICAAPTVLLDAGILAGLRHTGHSSIREELPELDLSQSVVVDGKVITSRGAGTALHFALALVAALVGRSQADEIAASIHFPVDGSW